MDKILGRKEEIAKLKEYYGSGRAEFVAIYGRRRVGKTYLVRNMFGDDFAFAMSGSIDAPSEAQLSNFGYALREYGDESQPIPCNWTEAFQALRKLLETNASGKRLLVFIDELPCLDTPRSGFMQAFEHFWNSWASAHSEIMLVVCGSATSWMISNLIDSHGGLHNRITREMCLSPFTLGETEEYLKANGFVWPRLSMLQIYTVIGGVPYYLSMLDKNKGVEANVDSLFFAEHGELKREYARLYSSLFKNADIYMRVIEVLALCRSGLTRKEIAEKLKMQSGGTLTKVLRELCNCEFVRGYNTREKKIKQKDQIYQLTDMYTLFYMTFCRHGTTDTAYWTHLMGQPRQNTWYGLAFERVCMLHIQQIKKRLGIAQIHTEYYSWRSRGSVPAAQIDLLIERADNLINLCEMKYSQMPYSITKDEDMKMRIRMADFVAETGVRHGVIPTFITTFGIRANAYSALAQSQVTMDDLFC